MSANDGNTSTQSIVQQWLIEAVNSRNPELDQVSKDEMASSLWYDAEYLGGAAAEDTITRTLQYWRCLSESENGNIGHNESMSNMMLFVDAKQHKSLIEFRLNAIKVYAQYRQDQQNANADDPSTVDADVTKKLKEKAVAALFGDSVLDSDLPWEAVMKAFQVSERWHRMATAYGNGTVWLVPLDPAYHSPGVQSNLTDSQFELWLELLDRRWPGLRDTAAVAEATLDGFHKNEAPPARTGDERPVNQDLHVIVEPPHVADADLDKKILESRGDVGPI